MTYRSHVARMEWGVPIGWAASYPAWEDSVRRFVREARAAGLTRFVLKGDRITLISGKPLDRGVDIIALPPLPEDAA